MARLILVFFILFLAGCSGDDPAPNHPLGSTHSENVTSQPPIESSEINATAVLQSVSPAEDPMETLELVRVPAGKFIMGSRVESALAVCQLSRGGCKLTDFEDEEPEHEVFLSEFLIYRTEVTNAQYRSCVEEEECALPEFLEFYDNELFANHPVVFVRWTDASTFCQWAGGRLPTEAEWEKGARGTTGNLFPWGNEPVCGFANVRGCTPGLTEEVGRYPEGASPYGVLNMAGNVAEWVADWYAPEYYSDSPDENPYGPSQGELKVARGGSWKNPFSGVRTSSRSANYPEVSSSGVGFRCVLDPQDP